MVSLILDASHAALMPAFVSQTNSLRRIEFLHQLLKSRIAAKRIERGVVFDRKKPKISLRRRIVQTRDRRFLFTKFCQQTGPPRLTGAEPSPILRHNFPQVSRPAALGKTLAHPSSLICPIKEFECAGPFFDRGDVITF